ncbi:MAG: CHAT domain-containing protein [Anaerolineae bacterium]|nr:CHAT domain-containing protein [Anaerolineae bacterium]
MGQYGQAEPMLIEAREITRKTVGENHPHYATRLTNLGILYESMGQYGQAEPLYRAALEILRKVVGENHPDYAVSLGNLGMLYERMGQPDQAESLLKQALEIRRKAVGKMHPDYATSLGTLAVLYNNRGQFDQAEPLFHQAVAISRQAGGENHPNYAACLSGLAYLCRSQARLDEALQYSLQAVEVTDQVIGQIFAFGSDQQRMVYLSRIQHETELLYSLVSQDMPDRPQAIITCFGVWLRRKALGTEGALVQREALLSGRYPALAPHIQQFKRLGQQLNDKLMAGPGDEAPAAYRAQLNAWQTEHRALEAELARQIPEMNLTQKMRATNPVAVAQALPPHTMLVEFVRFAGFEARLGGVQPARYLAFVLPAQQPEAVKLVDLGEAAPLEQLIAEFRATITGESETRGTETRLARRKGHKRQPHPDLALGQALRQAIFDPLRPALADCRRVFLSPDGDLTRLPFEILPAEGAGQRLIDTYTFSYLSVGRGVLRFGGESSGSATAPLVLADPDFDLAADQHAEPSPHRSPTGHSRELRQADLYFSRLPGTRLEGEQIARLLGVTPLLGANALESQLKKHTSPRILHLATHGYFLEDRNKPPAAGLARSLGFGPGRAGLGLERLGGHLANPLLRCGLALAGANTLVKGGLLPDEAENAILNGEDVAGMDLLTTELVVLSACETGLGQVKAGEGVFGLRRAFMLAGAKTLVMSLWAVPDHHTQLLMTDFYSRILAGEPRAEALRQAQLTLKATYDEPRYWGAFICQGEPGPLPR